VREATQAEIARNGASLSIRRTSGTRRRNRTQDRRSVRRQRARARARERERESSEAARNYATTYRALRPPKTRLYLVTYNVAVSVTVVLPLTESPMLAPWQACGVSPR